MLDQENRTSERAGPQSESVPELRSAFEVFSRAAGVFAVFVGCLVLLGWMFDIEIFKSGLPGLVAMNPISAAGFILAGTSLWFLRTGRAGGRSLRVARGCALVVALIGLLKLAQILFGWEFGVDQLLFPEKLEANATATGLTNRMAPNTASNFFLVGYALFASGSQTRIGRGLVQVSTLVLVAVSFLAILGYIFGVKPLYGVASYILMSLPAALAFIVLSVGILCSRPDRGLVAIMSSDSVGGVLARRLLPAAVLVPVVLGWLSLRGQRLGFYDTETGLALLVLANTTIFIVLLWSSTRALHRIDARREQAQEERSFLASIVESSNDAILGEALDGTITSCNRATERLYGYSVEEMVGRSATMLIPEDRAGEMSEILAKIHQEEKVDYRETVRRTKYGRHIDVEITVSPVKNSAGKIVGTSTTARDIGKRKGAEEALQESEEQLRLALDASSLGTWYLDLKSGEFVASSRAKTIHGLSDEDQFDNHRAFEAVHPEDRETVEKKVEQAISERGSYQAEYRVTRPDGTVRWISAHGRVYDRENRGGRLIGVVRDVTERKGVEGRLRESEQRYQNLTDAALEGIAIIEQGKVLEANRACADMFGYETSEIVGKLALDFVAPESRDLVRHNMSSGSEQAYEAIGIRKDGTRFVQELHGRASTYQGRPVRVTAMRDITERKRAEAELVREREFLAAVLESLKEGIVACDAEGKLTLFNRATQEFHGITGEKIGPDEWASHYNLYQADGRTPMRQEDIPLFRAYSGENVRDVEMVIAPEDGPIRALLANGQAFYDGDGNKLGAVVAMHDVTEQKRVEEELRESERQFKALTDATLEAIIITEQGKVLEVNRAYTTLFGYEPSEIVGRSALEMAAPESQDLIRDNISSGFEGSYEAVGLRKDGTRFDIEIHGTASRYRDRPARIAAIRDITERKRAEAEIQELNENLERRVEERTAELEAAITELRENEQRLHQSEDRLRLAVESTGLGTWDYDPVTGELRWDERCREIFGVSPDAAVDYETFLSGLHPEDRERTDRMVQATLNPESGGYFETEYRTIGIEDGIERWAAAHGKAFFDESGRAVRFIGTLLDITERKRAEEEVRQLNRTLEQRVEERTAQLEAAMSMADAANRAKSEFLANMSHEIRTPMNGVIGMTGLLLDTELSDEQSEYTETIRTSGENLMTVINDILDFSKIEAGRMDLEVIDFDLRPTVEETVGLLAERAYGKGLELISIVDSRVPAALRGDPGRIRQVLTNLLGNAVKLTERGEVLLRVSPDGERPGNKTVVRFSITDTGIGMTEDQRARLFRSFTQADASTTRKYGGTGLGLAISKQLVELMGGEIGVETEPGVGSCFWFAVPLEKQLDGERDGGLPVGSDLGDVRVLIVDDNETNRKILREQLAVLQMRSELAKDGPHALEALRSGAERNEPFDLVALDMRMPGMNGMQLARKIKTDPMISPARLLLLTSLGNRGEGEEARRAGIEAYLTKPVRQSELYDTIATLMGRSSSASGKTILVTRHALREREAGGRGRLLVVEDNAVNQKVAVKMLERLGYRADVAGNGREAVEAVSRIPYNAVLMDVQMPEMNGYEATREIRRREDDTQGCRTPIIAMTANAMQGDRENTLKAGMDDYVSKPVKPEALDEVLERWVRREKDGSLAGDDTADAASLEEDAKDSLDLSVLEGLRELQEEGEPGFLEELIELFLSDVPPRLEALRRATEEGDASSVERIAHTLKGSTGNLGALGMADLCEQLQGIGRSEDLAAAPVCFSHLEEEFERVRTALGEELEGN